MTALQAGRPRWLAFAATVAAAALLWSTPVARAATSSDATIGGERLAGTGQTVQLRDGARPLPSIKAASWVLADAETGQVLAHKGAHVPRAPASTLKMLTALTVLPRTDINDTTVISRKAASIYGTRVGLRVGKAYAMDDLWYAVFLPSANDAAIAVAEANGGIKTTIRQMNDVAAELRALDTVAKTPNGLDAPGQRSSAYDLALFAREGLKDENFARYASTARAQFPNVKGKGTHTIYTTNRMLLHGWNGAIGVKTGFTSQAGRTFAGAATRHGRTLIVTLMGVRESTEAAATRLLTWGFKNADKVEPVGVLVEPGSPLPEETVPAESASTESPADQPATTSAAAAASLDNSDGAGSGSGDLAAASGTDAPGGLPVLGILSAVLIAIGALGLVVLRRPAHGKHSTEA
jgi:D-alanyl-D-alanine carboxypeptidase (penicillin-binding protein 5/6)